MGLLHSLGNITVVIFVTLRAAKMEAMATTYLAANNREAGEGRGQLGFDGDQAASDSVYQREPPRFERWP